MNKNIRRAVALGIIICPTVAWANAGTPLMWASMLHLLFGNLLLGVLEGFLLAKLFGLDKGKTIGWLIPGNYFSAWLGGFFLRGSMVQALPLDLNNAWLFFWTMAGLAYLATIVLEFPFVALALRRDPQWRRKSIRGSCIIQTVSFVLLFGWYAMASDISLFTKMDIVQPSAMSLPEKVWVYFIADEDGNVYKMNLAATGKYKVFEIPSTNNSDRLFVQTSSVDSNRWDLLARLETEDRNNPRIITIRKSFSAEAAADWRSLLADPSEVTDSWFNFGLAARLGDAKYSPWEFWAGFWAGEGLYGTQTNTGAKVRFSFETPFGAWHIRNAALLPSDKVLFQMGENQICVLDPLEKQVALIAKGRGPIAVLDEDQPMRMPATAQNQAEPPNHRLLAEAEAILEQLTPPKAVSIVRTDAAASLLAIQLNQPELFDGDAGCALFGKLAHALCQLNNGKIILQVEGDAPTAVNPMDAVWAKTLADTAGKPIPVTPLEIREHQNRINSILQLD